MEKEGMNNDNRYFYDFVVADLFWKYETAGGLVRKAVWDSQRKKKRKILSCGGKINVADYYHTGDLYCIGDSSRKLHVSYRHQPKDICRSGI